MTSDALANAPGLLALVALLLLPGLLIVRAPWTAVPFLSLSFWIVSWWWLPGGGREGFVRAALLVFLVTASLRLLRPGIVERPSAGALLVLAAALGRLIPFFLLAVAPGADMSFHALTTLLMTWHDGPPTTYEPLLALPRFGLYPPGMHSLAADVALLSGLAPARAVFLVSLAAQGLLHVAAFALFRRYMALWGAGLAAVLAVALARLPFAFQGLGEGISTLALSLALAASAHLVRGSNRSPAVAAGFFLGAGVVSHGPLTVVAAVVLLLGIRPWRTDFRDHRVRLGLAGLTALLAAGPFLLRLPLTATGLARSLHAAGSQEAILAALALAGAAALALLIGRLGGARTVGARLALILLALTGADAARRDALALPQLVDGDDLATMAWIRENTRVLDLVCNVRPAGIWVPALAGRAVSEPWLPALYRGETGSRLQGSCAYTYATSPPLLPAPPAFRSGRVAVFRGGVTGP